MAQSPYPLPRETRETAILHGNGTVGPYGPTPFKVFETQDVEVWSRSSADDLYQRRHDVTITKTAAGDFMPVTVQFHSGVPNTTTFAIISRRLHGRENAVFKASTLSAIELEKELSKQGSVLEELRRDIDRGGVAVTAEPGRSIIIGNDGRPIPGPVLSEIVDAAKQERERAAQEANRSSREADNARIQADRASGQADRASSHADRASTQKDLARAAANQAQASATDSNNSAQQAHELVQAAVAGFQGFTPGHGYDFGWVNEQTTYFNRDWGTI